MEPKEIAVAIMACTCTFADESVIVVDSDIGLTGARLCDIASVRGWVNKEESRYAIQVKCKNGEFMDITLRDADDLIKEYNRITNNGRGE